MTTPKNIRITTYIKGHPKAKVLRAIWAKTHYHFRSAHHDCCCVMVNRGGQGSCVVPLRDLTPEEIENMTPQDFKKANHTWDWMATNKEVDDSRSGR